MSALEPRDMLFHLREWLRGHRQMHTQHFGHSDQSGHPHGYAGVVIPDWDVLQRLDEIEESLNTTPRADETQRDATPETPDTEIGMTTGELADLWPKIAKPDESVEKDRRC